MTNTWDAAFDVTDDDESEPAGREFNMSSLAAVLDDIPDAVKVFEALHHVGPKVTS